MATRKRRSTTNAIAILHRRYIDGRSDQEVALESARIGASIAQEIYDLRTKAGLTQQQLAKRVGTTHSVITRLEEADYGRFSLKLLLRISEALHSRLEVHFVPMRARRKMA